jgi:hypothetical protein
MGNLPSKLPCYFCIVCLLATRRKAQFLISGFSEWKGIGLGGSNLELESGV